MELKEVSPPLQRPTVGQLSEHGCFDSFYLYHRGKASWEECSLVPVKDLISQPSIPMNQSVSHRLPLAGWDFLSEGEPGGISAKLLGNGIHNCLQLTMWVDSSSLVNVMHSRGRKVRGERQQPVLLWLPTLGTAWQSWFPSGLLPSSCRPGGLGSVRPSLWNSCCALLMMPYPYGRGRKSQNSHVLTTVPPWDAGEGD